MLLSKDSDSVHLVHRSLYRSRISFNIDDDDQLINTPSFPPLQLPLTLRRVLRAVKPIRDHLFSQLLRTKDVIRSDLSRHTISSVISSMMYVNRFIRHYAEISYYAHNKFSVSMTTRDRTFEFSRLQHWIEHGPHDIGPQYSPTRSLRISAAVSVILDTSAASLCEVSMEAHDVVKGIR